MTSLTKRVSPTKRVDSIRSSFVSVKLHTGGTCYTLYEEAHVALEKKN